MAEKSKHEASAQFAKLQRANDAKSATAEYETAAAAMRAKTARLKALRLARDAAAPPIEPAAPKRKVKKKDKGNLAEFLDGQAKEGRNG
jgi:hypothetical protein